MRQWRSTLPGASPWVSVVETSSYLGRAARVLSPEEQEKVVEMLARDPTCGVLIKGTGGVRKVRFGVGDRGKSGGARVVYYFHNLLMPVFLLTVFSKNERANLSLAERNALARLVDGIRRGYAR